MKLQNPHIAKNCIDNLTIHRSIFLVKSVLLFHKLGMWMEYMPNTANNKHQTTIFSI